jgi:hypothetical protein
MRLLMVIAVVAVMPVVACNQKSDTSSPSDERQKTAASKSPSGSKAQNACELLTPTEIAGFLKVPAVKKDELNSGKNEMTKVDFCNWYVKEGSSEGVELRLRRGESSDEGSAMLVFSAAKGDAVEHDSERSRNAESLTGVGDQAIYSPYPDGKGGNIALGAGSSAVTITGSASKDTLVAMAKLVASRL